jgi:hypothetical protein
MPLVDFRDISHRFSHIDGRMVDFGINWAEGTASLTVSIYPWWEHPKFLEARAKGERWGFTAASREGERNVRVEASGLLAAQITRSEDLTDWGLYESHPLLWPYEDQTGFICNTPLAVADWLDIVCEAEPRYTEEALEWACPLQVHRHGQSGSFAISPLPLSLFNPIVAALGARGIDLFVSGTPRPRPLPLLLLLDEEDYIIAEDFKVDLPDFEHRDEWFVERGGGR